MGMRAWEVVISTVEESGVLVGVGWEGGVMKKVTVRTKLGAVRGGRVTRGNDLCMMGGGKLRLQVCSLLCLLSFESHSEYVGVGRRRSESGILSEEADRCSVL